MGIKGELFNKRHLNCVAYNAMGEGIFPTAKVGQV